MVPNILRNDSIWQALSFVRSKPWSVSISECKLRFHYLLLFSHSIHKDIMNIEYVQTLYILMGRYSIGNVDKKQNMHLHVYLLVFEWRSTIKQPTCESVSSMRSLESWEKCQKGIHKFTENNEQRNCFAYFWGVISLQRVHCRQNNDKHYAYIVGVFSEMRALQTE